MKTILWLVAVFSMMETSGQYASALASEEWVTVEVQLTETSNGPVPPGVRSFLTIPGRPFTLSSTVSDSSGRSLFMVKKPPLGSDLLFYAPPQDGKTFHIRAVAPLMQPNQWAKLNDAPVVEDTLAFFGQPDKRYYLDEYTRFSTMEEIFIEYMPEVRIRKLKNDYAITMLNAPYGSFFDETPLMLLDGFPLFNTRDIVALDPLSIRKIELMSRKYYFGSLVCSGILSIETYSGRMSGYKMPSGALVTKYDK